MGNIQLFDRRKPGFQINTCQAGGKYTVVETEGSQASRGIPARQVRNTVVNREARLSEESLPDR